MVVGKETRETKVLSVREFRDLGYLQELNRQFLHPLGLSLEVTSADPATGEEQLQVSDCREDPDPPVPERVDLFKTMLIRDEIRQRYAPRTQALGHWVQPAD